MDIYLQIEIQLKLIRMLWKQDNCSKQIRQLNQEIIALYQQIAIEPKHHDKENLWS